MKKLVIVFALFLLAGCATTSIKRDVRGPLDQPTLATIQAEVDSLWAQGNAYIQSNPDKQAYWVNIVPAFASVYNNLNIDKAYPYSLPEINYYGYQLRLNKLRIYLTNLGVTLQ